MKIIKHKFRDHPIDANTEILIIGTFNPDTENNPADFFYGRNRNFLWRLLATAFNVDDLKGKSRAEKTQFIATAKIDFIDLIQEVSVEEGHETNYDDAYLDNKVLRWRDIISELQKLEKIKKVCFTRKSFSDIPEMRNKIQQIKTYCDSNQIKFQYLTTPARFYRKDKQDEWTTFFTL